MSKAQTDIRTTSYDWWSARPYGYQGTIDDVLGQIRAEPDHGSDPTYTRYELLHYLGVSKLLSTGPSVELDQDVRYGAPDVPTPPWDGLSPFSLEYAMARWPENFRYNKL